jgi:hypothetical protein
MNHRILSWRDLLWLTAAFSLSGGASGTLATAVVTDSRTLLDLPWLVIAGSVGLAMFGGLVQTLFVMHAACDSGARVNVPLQVMTDLGRAAVLGILAYAAVVVNQWKPEVLLGMLPLLGVAGNKILDPVIKAGTAAVTALADRLAGKARE